MKVVGIDGVGKGNHLLVLFDLEVVLAAEADFPRDGAFARRAGATGVADREVLLLEELTLDLATRLEPFLDGTDLRAPLA